MSNEGTPAWGAYKEGTPIYVNFDKGQVDSFAYECYLDDADAVRPVRVIEETDETPKQSDYVLVPSPEHTKMCEDYKAAQASDETQKSEPWRPWADAEFQERMAQKNRDAEKWFAEQPAQASDAEQAGETVDVWRHETYTSWSGRPLVSSTEPTNLEHWTKGTATFPAVPDAPGVEELFDPKQTKAYENGWSDGYATAGTQMSGVVTRDVFAMLLAGEFRGAALEKGSEDFGWSYVPAKLSYRRPVPAQPSLEDVIRRAASDNGYSGITTDEVADIAAAVRAAFPELNEGNER